MTDDSTLHGDDESPRTDPTAVPRAGIARDGGRKIPHPKKKRPSTYRVLPREQRHGLVIVNTGNGKGKTTAAVGLLLRAAGRGMSVGMFQFVKSSRVANYGEQVGARALGIELVQLGRGCTVGEYDVEDDRALALQGWERCRELIANGTYDVLILDELNLVFNFGWLDPEIVIAALTARPRGTHVVLTGRYAPQAIIDAADLVTEMHMIKHPMREQRIGAQAGIDV